ncbi:hypothetical protein [Alkalinema sp. FACHB-956]|uniref:hypothetical protein n=1 Tax=Alkalinema sp. FACHB-956 TaxID=2692768 RepID=UPI00321FEDF5
MNLPNPTRHTGMPWSQPDYHQPEAHPLESGHILLSPGCHYTYRIIGPCCRLFDREQLPYPCCRIEWHGKEPSWRRIGKRYVPDMATKGSPSYSVEIVGQEHRTKPMVITLYSVKLSPEQREWWHSRKPIVGSEDA